VVESLLALIRVKKARRHTVYSIVKKPLPVSPKAAMKLESESAIRILSLQASRLVWAISSKGRSPRGKMAKRAKKVISLQNSSDSGSFYACIKTLGLMHIELHYSLVPRALFLIARRSTQNRRAHRGTLC
jgi:hypothetical protein